MICIRHWIAWHCLVTQELYDDQHKMDEPFVGQEACNGGNNNGKAVWSMGIVTVDR